MNASFSPETEAQAREMMRLVQLAFLRRLPALKWMTSADKMKAADKLTGMVRRAKPVSASESESQRREIGRAQMMAELLTQFVLSLFFRLII